MKNISIKNKKNLFFAAISIVFLVSFFFYIFNFDGKSYSFYFYLSGTDKLLQETKSIPMPYKEEKVKLYVEELLLGTSLKRALPVFPLGTRALFCFLNEGTLYLNLSENAIYNLNDNFELQKRIQLLEYNIKKNFHKIQKIELYIDGNPINFPLKNK